VLFTVLLKALTNQRATAFQTLDRKVRQHSSTHLSLSYQSAVAPRPVPSEAEQGKLNTRHRQDAIKTVIGDRSRLSKTVPSGQKQLPLHIRIAKGIYEESLPWLVSFSLPAALSLALQNSMPLMSHLGVELLFFVYCTDKLLRKLNVPLTPEPLINREWEDVARLVWASQPDTISRRNCVMGWFYDAPFDRLRSEDALSYLAWTKYGLPLESGLLSDEEIDSLCEFDLPLLLDNTNGGKSLPKRQRGEAPLPVIRFNCEPLRYRHKSLLFYAATHGAHFILEKQLKKSGFVHVPVNDSSKDVSYWYRLPSKGNAQEESLKEVNPLVFIHGVGGLGFCHSLVEDIRVATQDDNVPIVLIDLPHVSLRMYDEMPLIQSQTKAISKILDDVTSNAGGDSSLSKATLVGHSYGTAVMSWIVQHEPERIGACVFLDPICFQLHLKTTLFNFHFQRVDNDTQSNKKWDNPFSIGSLINLAGTEMHTNYAMLRQFSWATNALWPDDLAKNSIHSKIILSGHDEIVPVKEVQELFENSSSFLDTYTFEGASHGDLFMNEDMRALTLDKILDVMQSARKTQDTRSEMMEIQQW